MLLIVVLFPKLQRYSILPEMAQLWYLWMLFMGIYPPTTNWFSVRKIDLPIRLIPCWRYVAAEAAVKQIATNETALILFIKVSLFFMYFLTM